MSLYVYCVSDEVTEQTLGREAGVSGGAVRLLRAGSLAAVVSEIEEGRVAVTRDNVLAHERIVERVLARTTPLPFRFGTVTGEARLSSYLTEHEAALNEALARVRGAVEMSVKIIGEARALTSESGAAAACDAAEAGGAVVTGAGDVGEAGPPAGPGAAYLRKKRIEAAGGEAARRQAEEIGAWLAAGVGDLVKESDVRLQPSEGLAVRAAHLVERGRVAEYRARLAALRAGRPDLRFLTSGPWPPYSFSSIVA